MAEQDDPAPDEAAAPQGLLGRVREWSTGHPRRAAAIGAGFVAAAVGTTALWLAVTDLATPGEEATIELALRALDDGDDELAVALVEQMQVGGAAPEGGYGGPLFVLGAVKTREAERQWSADRRRAEFFIASKYLGEANAIGFPEGRSPEGLYLLGKSLIESRQLKSGIEVLLKALEAGTDGSSEAHRLLAEAYFYSPTPRYDQAVEHLDAALEDDQLPSAARAAAMLLRAEALSALGRHDDAEASVAAAVDAAEPARRSLVAGKVAVARLEAIAKSNAAPPASLAEMASQSLRDARRLDKLSTAVSRDSDYYLARLSEVTGRPDEALARYAELRRTFGSSPAGVAAALAEGDMHRARHDPVSAVEAYRRALDATTATSAFRSGVVPISGVRTRLREAHEGLLASGDFEQAIELVDHLTPLFDRTQQLALRAQTLQVWGELRLAASETSARAEAQRGEGLERLRAAGAAYEQLAEARFATDEFTEELWDAAAAYFRGQSFSSAVRVLDRYIRHQPEKRSALALLRLSQCYLALARPRSAISAAEECLEFHADEGPSYRARVEGAKAYTAIGEYGEAERLLRENLSGTGPNAMTPASPEWRDSLFRLGELLLLQHRYGEAIDTLGEAVDRYPDDPQRVHATYLVAEAHRHAAEEPLAAMRAANTLNERERSRALAHGHLEEAVSLYRELRTEITISDSQDELDRVTLRNCYMLGGAVLFQLGRYEEAAKSFASISTLYQEEPFLLEALVQISHCRRRLRDRVGAAGAVQQAKDLLARLPPDADFATSTNLTRDEWGQLLEELAQF